MRKLVFVVAVLALLAGAGKASAANVVLEGGATRENGTIKLVSNPTTPFSAVAVKDLRNLQLGEIKFLGAQFNVTDDGCAGGSPRFVLMLDDGRAVNVALGPAPSFNTCALNTWITSGNLVGQLEGCRWHVTSPVNLADPCLDAQELQALASRTVTEIRLVVDAGWAFADGEQTVLVRNVVGHRNVAAPTIGNRMSPGRACHALRAAMTPAVFASTFGSLNANGRNAHGKCASMMAHLKKSGMMPVSTAVLVGALATCKASGASGAALASCVLAQLQAVAPSVQRFTAANGKRKGKKK